VAGIREADAVHVHPIPPADQVMTTLSRHHIGLTLDPNDCLNRSLTICNKLFLYLQAGLACIATDTPGQRSVLGGGAAYGAVYAPGDVTALVAAIERLLVPSARLAAQEAAWAVGQTTYVWEAEQARFLDAVATAIGPTTDRRDEVTAASA
jgi:hypothetical protein